MGYHVQRSPIVCAVQGQRWHFMLDIIQRIGKTRGNVKLNGTKSFLSQNLLSNIKINILKCITKIFQIPKSVFFYQIRSNKEI